MNLALKYSLLAIIILIRFHCYSQHNNELNHVNIDVNPIAKKFSVYNTLEPSFSNGAIIVPVNIFNFNINDFTLDIGLNYSSSGITFTDSPLPLGYGWMLNINPRVNRVILGRPDEKYPFKDSYNPDLSDWYSRNPGWSGLTGNYPDFYEPLKAIINDRSNLTSYQLNYNDLYDSQKDIFRIQLPNKSITFLVKLEGGRYIAYSFGGKEQILLKVEDSNIIGVRVLDDDGVIYKFGNYDNEREVDFIEEYDGVNTSWLLRNIELINHQKISFKWVKNNVSYYQPTTSSYTTVLDFKNTYNFSPEESNGGTPISNPEVFDADGVINLSQFRNPKSAMLSQILLPNAVVNFKYSPIVNRPFLDVVEIVDIQNQSLIKRAKFTYGEVNSNYDHLLLKNIKINEEEYKFEYNSNRFANSHNTSLDYWGFFNGKNVLSQIPKVNLKSTNVYTKNYIGNTYSFMVGLGDKSVDSTKMKAFVLEKIIYPTGGYSSIKYEPHFFELYDQYDYEGFSISIPQINYGGGLRVKEIINYSSDNIFSDNKVYKYGKNEDGLARIKIIPSLNTFIDETIHWSYFSNSITLSNRKITLKPLSDYKSYDFGNSDFWYEEVSEYSKNGKRVMKFIFKDDDIQAMSSLINFRKKFTNRVFTLFQDGPKLLEDIFFKKESYGYEKVRHKYLTYNWMYDHSVKNMLVDRYFTASEVSGGIDPVMPNNDNPSPFYMNGTLFSELKFNTNYYEIIPGFFQLISEKTIEYTKDGSIINTNLYDYFDSKSNYVKLIRSESSNATVSNIKEFKYAWEYNTKVFQDLTIRNRIKDPVEESYNTNLSKTVTKKHFEFYDNNLLMLNETTIEVNDVVSQIYKYSKYDNYGNPLEVKKQSTPNVVFLWGYLGQFPIMKIENSTYDEIVTVLGKPTLDSLTLTSLSEHIMSEIITLATTKLRNDIRLNKAVVTSYTYRPLVGMTSVINPTGDKISYNYDGFHRLLNVLDSKNNIIKSYEYNNLQTKGVLPNVYRNTIQSRTFTKSNCSSGYVGSTVSYVIPEGTYSSSFSLEDANNKALKDIELNGQTYANINGICLLPEVYVTIPIQRSTGWNGNIQRISFYKDGVVSDYIFPSNMGDSETSFDILEGTYSRIRIDIDPGDAPFFGYFNVFSSQGVSCNPIGMSPVEINFYNITFSANQSNLFIIYEGCL